MGYSPEERDHLSTPLCRAMTKRGVPCRAFAGQGTDHLGFGPCKFHGGATGAHKKHALTLETKQRMIALSVPVENAQPHTILLEELSMSAGHVAFLREEITALKRHELGSDRSKLLLQRYDTERDRLARIGKACSEAGVDEAVIQIQQTQALQLVSVIKNAAQQIGLSEHQMAALGSALRKQVAAATGDAATAADADRRVAELRAEIEQDDQRRIEKAAQKYSGLTFPPEEIIESTARPA